MSSGKHATRAKPWATFAESFVLELSKTVSQTEMGPEPNSSSSTQALASEEVPSASIKEVLARALFRLITTLPIVKIIKLIDHGKRARGFLIGRAGEGEF